MVTQAPVVVACRTRPTTRMKARPYRIGNALVPAISSDEATCESALRVIIEGLREQTRDPATPVLNILVDPRKKLFSGDELNRPRQVIESVPCIRQPVTNSEHVGIVVSGVNVCN